MPRGRGRASHGGCEAVLNQAFSILQIGWPPGRLQAGGPDGQENVLVGSSIALSLALLSLATTGSGATFNPPNGRAVLGQIPFIALVGLFDSQSEIIKTSSKAAALNGDLILQDDRNRTATFRTDSSKLDDVENFFAVEVRSVEVRSVEVRSVEVRSGEVRSGEVRSGEVRSVEVRSGLDCLL